VIAAWIVLTIFGGYAAGQLSSRRYQSLAVPGKPPYEASQQTLKTLGAGDRSLSTVVFHSSGTDQVRARWLVPRALGGHGQDDPGGSIV
jgi:uncharacterized membrane protein YdfJ with MMPL/SSD domain